MFRRSGRLACGAAALCCLFVSSVSAQIIYEPVQYQYGQQNNIYYYGGSDPGVHDYARIPYGGAGRSGRAGGWAFASGDIHTHREVANEPTRTFTDALPYRNVTFFGFTPNDARNEAYANAPTYFRKRDLLNAAIPFERGWVVPAQAQPLRVVRDRDELRERPGSAPARPLMIIPRDQGKQAKPSDKVLADAK